MKRIFTLFFLLSISLFAFSQEIEVEEEPVIWAEIMPEFPGGNNALRQYIAENIVYPELARENDIQGTVYVRFVITQTGNIGEVQIVRAVDPLLDNEAVRVVKELPDFKPASSKGKPVAIWYNVPIVFKIVY
ncbi:MAG: energy transducer TonB [Bacteroidales bacterium]|nr:energy transducer TonB [Bacteroidales bacterium]